MIPELPLAPKMAALEMLFKVSDNVGPILDLRIMLFISEARFEPVSPSATGNTLIAFKESFSAITYFAPVKKDL